MDIINKLGMDQNSTTNNSNILISNLLNFISDFKSGESPSFEKLAELNHSDFITNLMKLTTPTKSSTDKHSADQATTNQSSTDQHSADQSSTDQPSSDQDTINQSEIPQNNNSMKSASTQDSTSQNNNDTNTQNNNDTNTQNNNSIKDEISQNNNSMKNASTQSEILQNNNDTATQIEVNKNTQDSTSQNNNSMKDASTQSEILQNNNDTATQSEVNKNTQSEITTNILQELINNIDLSSESFTDNKLITDIGDIISGITTCNLETSGILDPEVLLDEENIVEYNKYNYNGVRYYIVKEGDNQVLDGTNENHYPSVTSIIKSMTEAGLLSWRKYVGEKVANQICQEAAARGTRIHELCELYLRKKEYLSKFCDNKDKTMFEVTFIPLLNRISNIKCLEQCMISHKYKFAGTVDCIAELDGVMSIIDFKTSRKLKQTSYIKHYFVQATAYSLAYEEMTGHVIENLAILIGVDGVDSPQIFQESRKKWIPKFIELRNNFN